MTCLSSTLTFQVSQQTVRLFTIEDAKFNFQMAFAEGILGIPNAAVYRRADGLQELWVGTLFLRAEKRLQEAIIAHENGHLVHQHFEKFLAAHEGEAKEMAILDDVEQEIEADTYAAEQGYKQELLSFLINVYNRTFDMDILRRVENLERLK